MTPPTRPKRAEPPFIQIAEAAAFREVLARSIQLPAPPRFAFGTVPADIAAHYYQAVVLPAVGVYAGTGFELADGCLLRRDASIVLAPELKLHRAPILAQIRADPAREAAYDDRPRRRIPGSAALIIVPGYTDYGVWLTDILPRLALLAEIGWDLDDLVIPVPHDVPDFGLDLLRLIGVPADRILPTQPDEVLKADELLMPTLIHNAVRCSPILSRFVEMFRAGLARAGCKLDAPQSSQRLFLAGTTRATLRNAPAIAALAEASGFTIVRLATMTLPERFALFANATHIIGEVGADLATAVLSGPDTVLCGLRGSLNQGGYLPTAIAEVLGQPAGYVFGQSDAEAGRHDFTIPDQAFSDCLRLVFGPHAHFELQKRAGATALPPRPPPTPAPLRGYRSAPHAPPPPKPPFWQFWRRHEQPPPKPPRPEPGSLYTSLMAPPDDPT